MRVDELKEAARIAGQRVLKNRFILEQELGQGGMGVVYKACDLRKVEAGDAKPHVAIKLLSSDFKTHPLALATLEQETVKAQSLTHANIVKVYDFDRDGDGGDVYMTMELLEGTSLEKFIADRRTTGIPMRQSLELLHQICSVLSHAHDKKLIHADIKPGNIFITPDGQAKVLDFGVARAVSREKISGKFDVSELGARSVPYATCAREDGEPACEADDIYALACVTYEIFAGCHPFAGRSARQAQLAGLDAKRIRTLSARQWRTLSAVLSVDKRHRISSVAQFQRAFTPLHHQPVFRVAAGFLVAMLIATTWIGYQQYQARRQLALSIDTTMVRATSCYARADYTCAAEQSEVVLNLDPGHVAADQLRRNAREARGAQQVQSRVVQNLRDAEGCIQAADLECARVKVDEVLTLTPDHAQARVMRQQVAELLEAASIDELLRQADACLSAQDLECAQLYASKAEAVNARNPAVLAFEARLATVQKVSAQAAAQRDRKVVRFLDEANNCLVRGDTGCASAKAAAALDIAPADARAIALRQRVATAEEQNHLDSAKADDLVQQAQVCFQAGKFNCAVAKSESALDFYPKHTQASALKQKALAEQERLKHSIVPK